MRLVPPKELSLEQALEFIADDELVEVTPKRFVCANASSPPTCDRSAKSQRIEVSRSAKEVAKRLECLCVFATLRLCVRLIFESRCRILFDFREFTLSQTCNCLVFHTRSRSGC